MNVLKNNMAKLVCGFVIVVVVTPVLIDIVLLIAIVVAVVVLILMTCWWLFNVAIVTIPAMHVATNITNQIMILIVL